MTDGKFMDNMLSSEMIEYEGPLTELDAWLDANTGSLYKDNRLAQDWGRVAKIAEECGEVIDAYIRYTGQNPRKHQGGSTREVIDELCDVAITALCAIQHFTKSESGTWSYFDLRMGFLIDRAHNTQG